MRSTTVFLRRTALVLSLGLCLGCEMMLNTGTTKSQGSFRGPWLSRTHGQRAKYFTTEICYSGNFIDRPEYGIGRGYSLPPGLSLNRSNGLITGVPSQSGFWTVKVMVRDRNKGTIGHPKDGPGDFWWMKSIEIKIFDKLTTER